METVDFIKTHKGRTIIDVDFFGVLAMGYDLASARPTEGVVEAVKELDKKYQLCLTMLLPDGFEDLTVLPKYPRWARKHIDEDAFSGGWKYIENKNPPKGFYRQGLDTVLITANMSHPRASQNYGRRIWLCLPDNPAASCPEEMLDKVTVCHSWQEVLETLNTEQIVETIECSVPNKLTVKKQKSTENIEIFRVSWIKTSVYNLASKLRNHFQIS